MKNISACCNFFKFVVFVISRVYSLPLFAVDECAVQFDSFIYKVLFLSLISLSVLFLSSKYNSLVHIHGVIVFCWKV